MPFLIFGAFLQRSGVDFFIDLPSSIAGHIPGGPALIVVMGSAVFGSISGNPAANVVATDAFDEASGVYGRIIHFIINHPWLLLMEMQVTCRSKNISCRLQVNENCTALSLNWP